MSPFPLDRNPVRAGLVGEARAFGWSSAGAHMGGSDAEGLLAWPALESWGGCAEWEQRLRRAVDADEARKLREATLSGSPYGSAAFVAELERHCGRSLEDRGRGRPKKKATGAVAGA